MTSKSMIKAEFNNGTEFFGMETSVVNNQFVLSQKKLAENLELGQESTLLKDKISIS